MFQGNFSMIKDVSVNRISKFKLSDKHIFGSTCSNGSSEVL